MRTAGFDRPLYIPPFEVRPRLMPRAIEELQDSGVEPDVWKIDGLDCPEDCEKVVAAATRGGCDREVREWLTTEAMSLLRARGH